MIKGVVVRNVNEALEQLVQRTDWPVWRDISPRGLRTLEHKGPYITEYTNPRERVLFSSARDANPFFHLMESLWILAGRRDVKWLSQFNARINIYSDNGEVFHAAYGWRLRHHFFPKDQLIEAVELLAKDHSTRQVVLSIWSPEDDLGRITKDLPCNDLIMLKIRDGKLNMTVCCRSNDAIWGAYGANAVQFSMIQEFIASFAGVDVGSYFQISDSFHIYTDNEAWHRLIAGVALERTDHYETEQVTCYPICNAGLRTSKEWFDDCENFVNGVADQNRDEFFRHVAEPMLEAWNIYKRDTSVDTKNDRISKAQNELLMRCRATDWTRACVEWLERRREVSEEKK